MAEFQEVMKQAKRMCAAHEACYKCPLKVIRSDGFCKVLLSLGGIVLAAALAWTVFG